MNKLELIVDNKHQLFLGTDIAITRVRQNNFWREEVEFSFEYSEPFDIPYCDQNAAILGYPENINSSKWKSFPVHYKRNSRMVMQGQLVIISASYDKYSIALVRKNDLDLTKKLSEVCTEIFPAPDAETDMPAHVADGILNPYNWPQIALYRKSEVEKYKLNDTWEQTYLNYYHGTAEHFDLDSPWSPQFFLSYTIKAVCKHYAQSLICTWIDNPEISNKMLANTNVINQPLLPYERFFKCTLDSTSFGTLIYFTVVTPYSGSNYSDFRPYVGDVITFTIYRFNPNNHASAGSDTVSYTVDSSDINDMSTFMNNVAAEIISTNANYQVDTALSIGRENPILIIRYVSIGVLQLLSSNSVLGYDHSLELKVDPIPFSFTMNDIVMGNHMPDMSVSDFLQALKDAYNLAIHFDFSRNSVIIDPKKDLINWAWVDVTKYILANPEITTRELPDYNIKFETEEYEVLEKAYDYSDGQVTASPNYLSKNASSIAIALGWLYAPYYGIRNGNAGLLITPDTGIMPATEQETGKYEELVSNPFRLITWQGMGTDTGGNNYPKADMEDLDANTLYNTWWKSWLEYKNSDPRKIRAQLRIPPEVLDTFDPRHRWRISGIDHIWIDISETDTIYTTTVEANLARI